MLTIDPKDVKVVYVKNSWDGTILSGHAWYKDEYCYLTGIDETVEGEDKTKYTYVLYKLEGEDLLNELAQRKLFEDVVGYHCTKAGLDGHHNFVGGGLTSNKNMFWDKFKKMFPVEDLSKLTKIGSWEVIENHY